jgi:predicted HD superfamily hydrolase involved in NAD metabolism
MKRKVGVFFDEFDPADTVHLESAVSEAVSSGFSSVLMCLCRGKAEETYENRWRILVASCSGNRILVPVRTEQNTVNGNMEFLNRNFPEDELVIIDKKNRKSSGFCIKEIEESKIHPDSWYVCSSSVCLPLPSYEYIMAAGLYGIPSRVPESRRWFDILFPALKPHRFAHSLSVAATARILAERFGENPEKAEKAGLLHDCAKNLPLEEMRKIVRDAAMDLDENMMRQDSLLHSAAGACLVQSLYGVTDPEIIDAVASHNTGRPGMSRLSMCVCLADSIEPGRMPYPKLDEIRSLSEISLEKALLVSLIGVRDQVLSNGWYLHPRTRDTIDWLSAMDGNRS